MGPSISSACSAVPIIPITASLDLNAVVHERQQVPLRLSWAMTIHKSQGLTLEKAWIELGKTEKISGLSYVALSRVRKLCCLIIEVIPFDRLKNIKKAKTLGFRVAEENRLHRLAAQTMLLLDELSGSNLKLNQQTATFAGPSPQF